MGDTPEKPDIILLVADNLRYDCSGPEGRLLKRYGTDGDLHIPSMKELAAGGVAFSNAATASAHAAPSAATLFTGLLPPSHKVRAPEGTPLPDDIPTLWELLAGAGYSTAACGLPQSLRDARLLRGCQVLLDIPRKPGALHHTLDECFKTLPRPHAICVFVHDAATLYPADAPQDFQECIRKRLEQFFTDYGLPLPGQSLSSTGHQQLETLFARLKTNFFDQGLADPVENLLPLYVQSVSAMDAGPLGIILDTIHAHAQNVLPLIVFTSLRGVGLNRRAQGSVPRFAQSPLLCDGLMRVPLFLCAPGRLQQGVSIPQQVSLADIAPTLLAAAGGALPGGKLTGRCLLPLIEKNDREERIAYCERVIAAPEQGMTPSWLVACRAARTPKLKLVSAGQPLSPDDREADAADLVRALCRKRAVRFDDPDRIAKTAAEIQSGALSRRDLIASFEREAFLNAAERLFDLESDPDEQVDLLGLDATEYARRTAPLRDFLNMIS